MLSLTLLQHADKAISQLRNVADLHTRLLVEDVVTVITAARVELQAAGRIDYTPGAPLPSLADADDRTDSWDSPEWDAHYWTPSDEAEPFEAEAADIAWLDEQVSPNDVAEARAYLAELDELDELHAHEAHLEEAYSAQFRGLLA